MYNTDKFDLGYIDYIYNNLFQNRINNTKKLLEIGVYNGGSIKYWRDKFKNATIYGLDINQCSDILNENNIVHIVGNAYSSEICNIFDDESLDILIDDGPHTLESFLYLINNYLVKVKRGGIMIIEDIIHLSWTPQIINSLSKQLIPTKFTIYDMRFKQKTEQLTNRWQYGLDVLAIERI